ncbi:ammonium transporter, Amt family [Rhizobium sp. NFR07]|uniref:ammonium transporter n=1 Tax=Rhizobium sp. NFR07 TaxID=1566262 RepID=UPI0008EA9A56|nr:ammonium transporter [Rhizobium sp. NFR07]SFB42416.1 ammonium transporter, Amt family [Rhizobium sp. NFR07]
MFLPNAALAEGGAPAPSGIDVAWVLVAAALVMLMQVGFLLLEAGMVRSKNSKKAAQKNLLDFVFGVVMFAAVGFMLAFGQSGGLPFGADKSFYFLDDLNAWQVAFFVIQVMFCGIAATIVSGAVAERMKLSAYVFVTLMMSGLIYPVFTHWAWGDALSPSSTAFLANLDFIDFAGSTVVHATGGWAALAACLVLGPRIGRFRADGSPVRIAGHSPVLSTTGALLLFIGWIGFNGGSALAVNDSLAVIIVNTLLAGSMGACVGYVVGFYQDRVILPEKSNAGMLGGLVAVTAGCQLLDPAGALLIGAIGGSVAIFGNALVERKLKVDDAVGAIGIHAFAGVAGTLLVALLVPVDRLPAGGRLAQLWIQAVGIGINFYWAFGASYLLLRFLDRFFVLRVSARDEEDGLNIAEHATRLGVGHVEDALADLLAGKADLARRLPVIRGDEAERLTGLFNDLMDKAQAEERSREQNLQATHEYDQAERVAALASATFEAILIHRDGVVLDGNEELAKLVGRPLSDLIGRQIFEFLVDGETIQVSEIIKLNDDRSHEIFIRTPDDGQIPVAARGRDITFRGENARVGCFVDLRERKEAEKRIRYLAQHDPLTGLPNRVLFTENLAALMQEGGAGRRCGIVKLDLDRFKDINDIHGHQAGDEVIRMVATRLQTTAGSRHIVTRLGGDEFAVILDALSSEEELEAFGNRVLVAMAAPVDIGGGEEVSVTVSMGGALWPAHAVDMDALIGCADVALSDAKNSGRNAFRTFLAGMNDLIEKRRALEADLEQALHQGQFEIYLQPRVKVEDVSIVGYEALLRWNHPQRGMISPADFIPVAEASGKIIRLGQWVLAEACQLLGQVEGHISVNVSPLQFRHTDFVEHLSEIMRKSGADPRRLELEITESVLIDDDRRAVQILNDVKRMGVAIALDDFGTGYSSLSYLSRYPFDTIKIDRSFVKNLSVADNARMIVRTIIELGVGLGMKIVAEGVETLEEAMFLGQAGCHELQGFLLGRPEPLANVVRAIEPQTAKRLEEMPKRQPEMRDVGFAARSVPRLVKFNS